jgi:bifunctional non-homologous end joining protein LigD
MAKKTFPTFVPPMMANSAKEPFDSPDWIFELKLDGCRAITVFDSAGKPHIWSRNALPLESHDKTDYDWLTLGVG